MKKLLIAFIFILPLTLNAQNSPALEIHEVDSVAIPNGGYSYLEKFIEVNRQTPYMAKVTKIDGIVTVSGIVDEKGKISSVSIIKGLRPDCDKEAIRVFSLFNAWKPAIKNGKNVSQKVTQQILFKSTENINFVHGKQLDLLDESFSFTNDPLKKRYVQKSTIDTLSGLALSNIDIYEVKKNGKEALFTTFIPYAERDIVYALVYPEPLRDTSITRTRIRYYGENQSNVVNNIFVFWGNENLQQRRYKTIENPDFPFALFYSNGMVREWTDFADDKKINYKTISWYPNGQIEKIILHETPLKSIFDIVDMWSVDGIQFVKNGHGEAILKYYQQDYKILVEKGAILN